VRDLARGCGNWQISSMAMWQLKGRSKGRKRAKERGVRFGRPRKMTPHQRQEALQRLAAGETQADVARTYNVDATTIGRLLGDRPFHGGASGVALQ
jgi:transposase